MKDTTYFDGVLHCQRCGARCTVLLPCSAKLLTEIFRTFQRKHQRCKAERPAPPAAERTQAKERQP